jgi:3-hydroxybutyryl-CoA dehydrogenase
MESIYHQYYEEPRYRPSVITAQRLQAGVLGRKSGSGFYDYEGQGGAAGRLEVETQPWQGWFWVSRRHPQEAQAVLELLQSCAANIEQGESPTAEAICLVTPLGGDASSSAIEEGLDPARTLAVDSLLGCQGRVTLMRSPAVDPGLAQSVAARLRQPARDVTLIADSPGFVAQRVLATIINIACDIVQQGICTPEDLDTAVELGLGYPLGPLAWGDKLESSRILSILQNMHAYTGDPRYRPSLWLQRRAKLGLSLKHAN